ncbi:MAG: thioredoxin-dependent thiol peroxidase [Candidatus Gracilibacteria bacterium]|nr:thioredoxin-dependent thiol peroxidase [Candidatus Gracilibacteria bacterium]
MLAENSKAPDFTLKNAAEQDVRLSDFAGKQNVVLYFYPKDLTPGCTVEALAFSALGKDFEQAQTKVLGISMDSCEKHQKFIEKKELTVELLSDPEGKVCELYGVFKEKSMYGKTFMGIERSTFVIDKEGVIRKVYRKVNPAGHAEKVLEFVKKGL